MKNEIEQVREDIKRYFDKNNRLGEEQFELSVGGLFYFTRQCYKQNDPKRNWVVSKIKVYSIETNEKIVEYFSDGDEADACACWLQKEGMDYLILPEATQGQSIVDTRSRGLHSFYSPEEPFVWLQVYPSPSANRLAVVGCYWACPLELRVYNSEQIASLPYPLLYQSDFAAESTFKSWKDDEAMLVDMGEQRKIEIKV